MFLQRVQVIYFWQSHEQLYNYSQIEFKDATSDEATIFRFMLIVS